MTIAAREHDNPGGKSVDCRSARLSRRNSLFDESTSQAEPVAPESASEASLERGLDARASFGGAPPLARRVPPAACRIRSKAEPVASYMGVVSAVPRRSSTEAVEMALCVRVAFRSEHLREVIDLSRQLVSQPYRRVDWSICFGAGPRALKALALIRHHLSRRHRCAPSGRSRISELRH